MKKLLIALSLFTSIVGQANAATDALTPAQQPWSFKSYKAEWDKTQILRGYQVAKDVCLACHSLKYIKHRDLMKVGFTEAEVKQLAQEMEMSINDPLMSPLTAEDAVATYAKELPDLSVINKARHYGADYVYALLTGYTEAPADVHVPDTASYNPYFAGGAIAMPAPLAEDQVEYIDGTPATVEQMAKDVSYFLQWTAEPELIERQQLGVFVLLYVAILAILLYFTKRRIWHGVKKEDDE